MPSGGPRQDDSPGSVREPRGLLRGPELGPCGPLPTSIIDEPLAPLATTQAGTGTCSPTAAHRARVTQPRYAGVRLHRPANGAAGVSIANLAAGRAVNVAGLQVEAGFPMGGTCGDGLRIVACQGPVQIRDCSFAAKASALPGFGVNANAANVASSEAVSIVDTTLDASEAISMIGFCNGDSKARGLLSTQSRVFVHGSSIASGMGSFGDFLNPPGAGGDGHGGWTVVGGFGLGVRTTSMGGGGGNGVQSAGLGCGPGGDGGPGLTLLPTSFPTPPEDPSFVRSSMVLVPGVGGLAWAAPCTDGVIGADVDVFGGSIGTDDFAPRTLKTEYLVRVGEVKTETFVGEPFDLVWHVFGLVPADPIFVPDLTGAPTVGSPFFVRFRGFIPAAGEKTLNVTVSELGIDFVTLYEEAYFYDGSRFYLSNPQFSVLLDDAF